ncbi:hypothetical protein QLG07_15540 [Erwinia sp. V90_4]|uniref:hypothetical protein n=1 Tax=Erwinia sp. V90_4 TaxID=3044239 RepID=UPI00249D9CB1|nr:hypothetical protein [Erwinia sp. V90_4]MDI3440879.1 hypothetical protein [Erwinia sp. V90_4]
MKITHSEVRQQLAAHLSRLWRYGMVLSRNRDVAEELVQSTCVRAPPAPAQHRGQVSRRALIAASLSFLFIGSGIGYFARPESASRRESGRIRDLEAQYMSLYSTQTLADVDNSPPVIARSLERTAREMGLRLSAQQLALPDAELKSIRLLRYDDASIAQIVWDRASEGPMALCISREQHQNLTPVQDEKRHGMSLAWWHARGYQYVLIGRSPTQQMQQRAGQQRQSLS